MTKHYFNGRLNLPAVSYWTRTRYPNLTVLTVLTTESISILFQIAKPT